MAPTWVGRGLLTLRDFSGRYIGERPRYAVEGAWVSLSVTGYQCALCAILEEDNAVAGDTRHLELIVHKDACLLRAVVAKGYDGTVPLAHSNTVAVLGDIEISMD